MPRFCFTVREVQSILNGYLCLFKPRDVSVSALQKLLLNGICEQANCLDHGPIPVIEMPIVEEHPRTGSLLVVGHRKQIDYSMHPLMVGRLFQTEDMRIEALHSLEPSNSGVCLFGLNSGCDRLEEIRGKALLNEYYLEGELGRETVEHQIRGKVSARAEYGHVTMHRMKVVLSMIRAHFKKVSFEFANVDLHSQEAFELFRQGVPRPRVLGSPLIYGIELRQFTPPTFKIHIQVTGETDIFLRELVHEIGCLLQTVASPRRIRRVRQACFGLDHALLDKHFHLETILKNLLMTNKMLESVTQCDNSGIIKVKSNAGIDDEHALIERYRLRKEPELLEEEEDCLRIPWGRNYEFFS